MFPLSYPIFPIGNAALVNNLFKNEKEDDLDESENPYSFFTIIIIGIVYSLLLICLAISIMVMIK